MLPPPTAELGEQTRYENSVPQALQTPAPLYSGWPEVVSLGQEGCAAGGHAHLPRLPGQGEAAAVYSGVSLSYSSLQAQPSQTFPFPHASHLLR